MGRREALDDDLDALLADAATPVAALTIENAHQLITRLVDAVTELRAALDDPPEPDPF